MKKRTVAYILVLIIVLVLQYFNVLDTFEKPVEDKLYQTGSRISNNIYVIGIDEETLIEYGDFETFSRDKMADLINLLMADEENQPAVIAIDVGYYSERGEEEDAKLVEAVKNAGNVVLVSTITFGQSVDGTTYPAYIEEPFAALEEAAAGVGHSNYQMDSDGVIRHSKNNIEGDDGTIKSFAKVVYETYAKKKNIISALDSGFEDDSFYIVYSGSPRTYYGSVGSGCSFSRVLSGEYPTRAFKDAIVFIGSYATGMHDNYYSSIDKQEQMFGVEVHANIVNQFLNNEYKSEASGIYLLIPTLLVGLLALFAVRDLKTKFYIPVNILISVLYVFFCSAFYNTLDIALPVLLPPIMAIAMMITAICAEIIGYTKEKKSIIDKYSKFLPPVIAKKIASEGEDSVKLGGESKEIAILFVDIRNFTGLSEMLKPFEVVEFLNSYFDLTTKAILDNEGTVDKFVGDETMAIFNAPLNVDNYIEKAVNAGLDMVNAHKDFDDRLPEKLKGKVSFGVGVHFGEVVVGNIGTSFRMDYTAIGDAVNTAARLQAQAKAGEVVVSSDVYEVIKDHYNCEYDGKVKLKGKANEMDIYLVLSKKEEIKK